MDANTHTVVHNCQAQTYKGGQLDYAVFLSWIPMPLDDQGRFKNSSQKIQQLLQADPRLRIVDGIKGKDSLLDLVLLSTTMRSKSMSLEQLKERLCRSQRMLDSRVEQVLKEVNDKNCESLSLDALEKLEEQVTKVIQEKRKSKVIREQIEEQLRKSNLCKVCNVKPKSVAFVPCGHFEVCQTCADETTVCHICKATVTQKLTIRLHD